MASREQVESALQEIIAKNLLPLFDPAGVVCNDAGQPMSYAQSISDEALRIKVANHLDQSNDAGGMRNAPEATLIGSADPKSEAATSLHMLRLSGADLSRLTDLSPEGIRAFKQEMRRKAATQELVMGLTTGRVNPGSSSMTRFVTWEQHTNLLAEYRHNQAQGMAEAKQDYLPFASYGERFVRLKIPILTNEMGRFQMGSNLSSRLAGKVAVLRDKEFSVNTTVFGPSHAGRTKNPSP